MTDQPSCQHWTLRTENHDHDSTSSIEYNKEKEITSNQNSFKIPKRVQVRSSVRELQRPIPSEMSSQRYDTDTITRACAVQRSVYQMRHTGYDQGQIRASKPRSTPSSHLPSAFSPFPFAVQSVLMRMVRSTVFLHLYMSLAQYAGLHR